MVFRDFQSCRPFDSFGYMLSVLKEELGSLDHITAWVKVLGMINVAPGFNQMMSVINGFS